MKIKQIAVAIQENGQVIYALSEDGLLYQEAYVSRHAPTEANPYARDGAYYWELVDHPVGIPERFKAQPDKEEK